MVQSYDLAKSISLKLNKKIGVVILHYYDSAGNQLVKDGEGEMIEYNKRKPGYWMSRGLTKRRWRLNMVVFIRMERLTIKKNGSWESFLKGTSYNENEKQLNIANLKRKPHPQLNDLFYSFIGKSLKYPSTAKN